MKKEKIMYLDVARILATIAVVLVHIASLKPNWTTLPYNSDEWAVLCSYASITKWAAPMFCLISGALFLDPDRTITLKKLYTSNIPRIVVGLVFWSFIYASSFVILFDTEYTVAEFIKKVACGNYHQWYLYMITGFYILVPVLRKITADKQMTKYLLCVSIFFNFIIPFLQLHEKLDWTTKVTHNMFIELPGYLAYFLVGYYIHKYGLNKLIKLFIYLSGVPAFVITVTQTVLYSAENGSYFRPYTNYNALTTLIQTIFIFVLIKDICGRINFSKKAEKSISLLSKDTFGIYHIHALVLTILTALFNTTTTCLFGIDIPPVFGVPAILIITYLVCEAISHILNKIPIVKKYLV